MSNFPVFHGITLAQNAYVENLNLEVLASDPVPVGAGRVWFNSTDKLVKFSTLNSSGAVIVKSFGTREELVAEIARVEGLITNEAATRAADDLALGARIDTAETTAAANLVEAKAYTDAAKASILGGITTEQLDTIKKLSDALQDDADIVNVLKGYSDAAVQTAKDEIRGAVGSAFDTLAELEAGLAQEISDRQAAVAAEEVAREAGDDALDARLTTVEGQVNGKIGNLTSLSTDDKSNIVAALNEVDAHADEALGLAAGLRTDLTSEISRAEAAEAGLAADLAAEVTAREAAVSAEATARAAGDTTNANAISAEVTRAQAAEATLTSDLAAEVTARQAAVSAEATARAAADTTNANAITAEVSRAQAAEAQLTTDLAAEATARAAAVTAEANTRAAADTANANAISAEATRAQAAEAQLSTDIGTEAAAREAAVSAEATARAAADTTNANAIAAETTRAQAAEATLTSDLAAEVTRAQAAEAVLTASLAAADAAVKSAYNATIYTYQAVASATVHTITHGLGSSFVDVNVMVERADGSYRNDIVSVEEVDTNTVKVYLSQALKVKVIARAAVTL